MLITETYRELNAQLHANPKYGSRTRTKVYQDIREFMHETNSSTLLDYGCGKGEMAKHLTATCYDPCVEQFNQRPQAHDMVACCDVLEHIEPELLTNVLEDIEQLAQKAIYLVISTRPAAKTLADGRNAHLIVQGKQWWTAVLAKAFMQWHIEVLQSNIGEITVFGVRHGSR